MVEFFAEPPMVGPSLLPADDFTGLLTLVEWFPIVADGCWANRDNPG
jgi:hypothetical protein